MTSLKGVGENKKACQVSTVVEQNTSVALNQPGAMAFGGGVCAVSSHCGTLVQLPLHLSVSAVQENR